MDRNLAETLINVAQIVARGVRAALSAEEIELFVRYVGPVRNHSLDSVKAAIAEMHRECLRRGLRTDDENAMHRFVWRQQSQNADE